VLALLLTASAAVAQFNPPRIFQVIHPSDVGTLPDSLLDKRLYYIDAGLETNINEGDLLNVYRDLKVGAAAGRPVRLFIGTMVIVDAQNGLSVGRFVPNAAVLSQPQVRYKTALKGDIVMPRLAISTSALFDQGKADLKPGAGEEFKKVGDFVQNLAPSKIVIEGHTDSDGDEKENFRLSEQRAQVVRQYLINTFKFITPGMIEAKGFGEERPMVNNDTPENKTLNRRIEIIVWE
jgi:outer membrane protein OmpA-like peptidoglycan-associated protein